MDRRIGSYFLLLGLVGLEIFADQPRVVLSMTDMRGNAIRQARVGVPFTLVAEAIGTADVVEYPALNGLDGLQVEHVTTGNTVRTVNGAVTM